jgi:hypothetical protein
MSVLTTLLEQLRDVITLLPVGIYRARPAARVSGSIGEHVRHCLDHVAAVTGGLEGEVLSYDKRLRGTTVETDPTTAVSEIERLCRCIERLKDGAGDRAIVVSSLLDPGSPPQLLRSTIAREHAFVVQHTIHHCALIALLLEWQGWRVPYGFGVAPSTAIARAAAS